MPPPTLNSEEPLISHERIALSGLGINHQSPLIHLEGAYSCLHEAGNQSPIPFDTLNAY